MISALSLKDLHKTYSDGHIALTDVSLNVEQGDFFALLGPNGAGKSTTIGIVCSLVKKTSGTATIFEYDIDQDFALAKKHIGVVPQEFNFNQFEMAYDIVVNQAGYYGLAPDLARSRAVKFLRELGLWEKRFVQSRFLSGGMKRRLMIARALVHEPKLLILDEPTAGVDIEMRRTMWEFLRRINNNGTTMRAIIWMFCNNGTTIILTTHYLEEAEALCRNIAIIDHGKIVENTTIRNLITQLHREVFILDSVKDLPPQVNLPGFSSRVMDSNTLEIEIEKGQSINEVFSLLNDTGIEISSMRNRANRLEEMFVNLTEKPIELT